ncbi:MAG: aromatic-ring-hydroxylating dioxygenase subunit beta [Alphaproteobacteria bacterium]|nr:aromatic-ring-hydroxylating dioxygenase subunit beta [Alphaproteobacteria bacterium]
MREAIKNLNPADPIEELLFVRALERFVVAELELLDGRAFEQWRDLFTADGVYWAPSRPDQQDPKTELSLFYDDREIMDTRIRRLRHPRVHAQIPYSRTTHVVSSFVVDARDDQAGTVAFHCAFVMHEFRPELEQRAFAGRYDYRLVTQGGRYRIKWKKATAINCDAMHYPISTPL